MFSLSLKFFSSIPFAQAASSLLIKTESAMACCLDFSFSSVVCVNGTIPNISSILSMVVEMKLLQLSTDTGGWRVFLSEKNKIFRFRILKARRC